MDKIISLGLMINKPAHMSWLLTYGWIVFLSGSFLFFVLVILLPHVLSKRKKDYPRPQRNMVSAGRKLAKAKDPLLIRLPKLG